MLYTSPYSKDFGSQPGVLDLLLSESAQSIGKSLALYQITSKQIVSGKIFSRLMEVSVRVIKGCMCKHNLNMLM